MVADGSVSGIDVGNSGSFSYAHPTASPGGGGTVNAVSVRGGSYGVRVSASQWYLDQLQLTGQTVASLQVDEAWAVVLLHIHAENTPIGVQTIGTGENIMIISSHFGPGISNGSAIVPVKGVAAGQILLSNVSATADTKFLVEKLLPLPADCSSKTWSLGGQVYDSGVPRANTTAGHLSSFKPPRVATDIPARTRPSYASVNVVTSCGVAGDGVTDDTAALQKAIDTHPRIFLPYGSYLLSDTVTLTANTSIIGEGMPHVVLKDGAKGFGDASKPKPMFYAPSNADATVVLGTTCYLATC